MPVVRVKDKTYKRLMDNAKPLADSVNDVVGRALDALEIEDYQSEERKLNRFVSILRLCWIGKDICISGNEI